MFAKVEIFCIKSKSKRGFKKRDMHIVITIELTTIVSSVPTFQPELVPMFFHMDYITEFIVEVCYHCCHCHWYKGNKG
jgi:hypothetical protein